MKSSYLTAVSLLVSLALGNVAGATNLEQCVTAKKSTWMSKQNGVPLSVTGRAEMGACRKPFGCSSNWSKDVKSISAKKGFQLKPGSVTISKTFSANPKRNNYVKQLPKKYGELAGVIHQKYLKTVTVEVACHRRGSPGKAGCDAAGSISAIQIPLLSNSQLLSFVADCSK